MSLKLTKNPYKPTFQSKTENPVIRQTRAKNYLVPDGKTVRVFDAPVEGQLYNKTIVSGSQGEEYGNE